MSFGLPWIFAAGVAAALGVVALHLLSTRRPPAQPLPTARFVPETDLRAVSRSARPTDLLLLLLRALAVLAIGVAFARPQLDAPGPSLRRVVALEWTTALADTAAARRAARALLGEGDALVVFDTAARVVDRAALDALPAPTVRRVALSPMLVAVHDAAVQIAPGADSLALSLLSAMPADAWDAATPALRAAWPGRVELQALTAPVDTSAAPQPELLPRGSDDLLLPALAALPAARGAHPLRIRRGAMLAEDSLWLSQTAGAVLLQWPTAVADSLRPDGVLASHGLEAGLVAAMARLEVGEGQVIARWRDGVPAVTERALGRGCLRDVGIGLGEAGDVTLRAPFDALLAVLATPCGGARRAAPADSVLAAFAGRGERAAAQPFVVQRGVTRTVPLLLAAALALLLVEQWLRRQRRAEVA